MSEQQGLGGDQQDSKNSWSDRISNWQGYLSGIFPLFALACIPFLILPNDSLSNFVWAFAIIGFLVCLGSLPISKYADKLVERGFDKTGRYIGWLSAIFVAAGAIAFSILIRNFLAF